MSDGSLNDSPLLPADLVGVGRRLVVEVEVVVDLLVLVLVLVVVALVAVFVLVLCGADKTRLNCAMKRMKLSIRILNKERLEEKWDFK